MKDEEHGLIREILAGNQELYSTLVDRYRPRVYSTALKMTGNPTDAEDLAQEAFIRAYRSLPTYRFESSFSTWIYRITVNLGLDRKRKKQSHPIPPESAVIQNLPTVVGLPESSLLAREEREEVRTWVRELPDKYRSVVTSYYLEHHSCEQIATELGIATKTVETRLHRARKMLKIKGKARKG
ncbi:RNA polymerase sigma-70 factor, ECF subfamily [Marininema mesophilum]|uniref:RNA polymerase sigma factor n=1 Tax=Marininema mesophilum TaxID=1048340 RepID=A0A1H2YXS4_9BACL|nr:sigma-70 family RNA polymerase sigma factor [Marininema mesophilum]SDX09963.1 RNA polymerase sigma-70 factor, ECF subfamily [Marininema mesophilum]